MSSTVDKFFAMMRMNNQGDEENEGYDVDDYEDDYEEEAPRKASRAESAPADYEEERPTKKVLSRPQGFRNSGSKRGGVVVNNNGNMEVCVCKPTVFEDATQIADALLDNRSVVLNLEGLEITMARRIFDFASGACYALKGRMESISKYVYVITPECVNITGVDDDNSDVMGQSFGE